MTHRVQRYEGKKKTTQTRMYVCATYSNSAVRECTFHHIRHDELYSLVLQSIQKYAALSKEDKAAIAKQLLESGNHQQAYEISQAKKALKASEKRLFELERLIMKLYEEYVAERISGDNYSMMMSNYQKEQSELKQRVSELNEVLAKNNETVENVDRFLNLIKQYADVKELTQEIVCQLISKITVHEAQKVDGVKRQQINIHWRFVGNANLCL